MRDFIENIINGGEYNLEELDVKIKRLYVMGDLTETDMEELLVLAAEKANNAAQIDIFAKLVDLEHRIVALETDGYATWSAGYVTKKGEIVKIVVVRLETDLAVLLKEDLVLLKESSVCKSSLGLVPS